MRIFENKSIFKKLIIVLLAIMIFSFCMPKTVRAEDSVGGKLLDPIMSMFVGLNDGAISLLQKIVLKTDVSMIEVDSSTKGIAKILGIVVAVTIVVAGIIAVVASGGTALAIAGSVLTVLKAGAIAGVITFCISSYVTNAVLPEDFVLPQIKLSPYEIFANQIPLFDVDFFNPMENEVKTEIISPEKIELGDPIDLNYKIKEENKKKYAVFNFAKKDFKVDITDTGNTAYDASMGKTVSQKIYEEVLAYFEKNGAEKISDNKNGDTTDEYELKVKNVPYRIKRYFSNANRTYIYEYYNGKIIKAKTETKVLQSTARQLQGTISNWYVILRDLSLVALLSILVYVGIRIIISSTSNDKAKYKQMLVDWLVAICLLFVMHYIMSFSNMIVKKVTNMIDATDVVENAEELPKDAKGTSVSKDGAVLNKGVQLFKIDQSKQVNKAYEVLVTKRAETEGIKESETEFYSLFTTDDSGNKVLNWPANNFTEQARMMLQYIDEDEDSNNYAYSSIGYKLIYCVLVIYTFIFTFTYLKRAVYMAFLTLIAPLVALTYPIDKMNDGQAQAFNKWMKEYIFNLLIQPLHLILYMVLIGSAMDFASQNIIYVIIALGFLTQGEKLLRTFFGFEKAHTPGFLAGPAGAAVLMNGFNKLLGKPPRKGGNGPKNLSDSSSTKENSKINYKEDLDTSSLFAVNENNLDEENRKLNNNKYKDDFEDINNKESAFNKHKESPSLENSNYTGKKDIDDSNIAKPLDTQIKNSKLENIQKPNRRTRTIKGLKNVGNRIKMKSAKEQPLRRLARVGTGLAGAAVAASAAGIIGITSGDPSKAIQYMGAGAIGGFNVTKRIPDEVSDLNESRKEYVEAFKEGYYTDKEYTDKQIQKNIKEMKKNEELKKELERQLGSSEAAEMAIDTVGEDCVRYGLADSNEIAATYQGVKEGYKKEETIRHVKFAKEYGKNTSKLGHKDSEDLNNTIIDRVRKNSKKGTSEEEIQRHAIKIREDIDRVSKTLYKKR